MSNSGRLVVLASSDSEELTQSLNESLAGWCAAGLLGEVVWAPASEFVDQGYSALCWCNEAGEWTRRTFGVAMSRLYREEVWLAVLRHPHGPGGSVSKGAARRREQEAHAALEEMLGSAMRLRSLTVQVADRAVVREVEDCMPIWDFHLIHDSSVEAHESLPRLRAADREALSLCALVALCAAGGWSKAVKSLEWEPDRSDGPYKPARYVHAQMRILHAPPVPVLATPKAPPWPLPNTAGVTRARPVEVPPLRLAEFLAKQSRFVCEPPPLVPDPPDRFSPRRVFSRLFDAVPWPVADTKAEQALKRLGDRTGGFTEASRGESRLKLDDTADLPSLIQHLERSDFVDIGLSHRLALNPEAWQTMRETMFGLVDGGPLPAGVTHPALSIDGDSKRLIWTDPSGVAPPVAPAEATDLLAEPEPPEPPASSMPDESMPDDGPAVGNGRYRFASDNDEEQTDSEESKEPPRRSFRERFDKAEPTPEPPERVAPRDTLMERLADTLRRGLLEAQRGFRKNCGRVSVADAYDDARAAQRSVRFRLLSLALLLVVALAYAIDQRWSYLARVWEFATPFEALTNGGTSSPLAEWYVLIPLYLAVATALLWKPLRKLNENFQRFEYLSARRERLGRHCGHYAVELVRLYNSAQQFSDHRSIITEFLHRPFGPLPNARDSALSPDDLAFQSPPPHSMLVACAEVTPPRLDALRRRKQESAVDSGWLTDCYHRVYRAWSDRYRERFLGNFDDPDHDILPRDSVARRDRHDHSDVYGARTEFSKGVAADPDDEGSGWAVRQATDDQVVRYQDDELADEYLELFESIKSVHGLQPGIDAKSFFTFADQPHRFDWNDLLRPGAHRPAESSQPLPTRRYVIPDAAEGRSLVVGWRLDLSGAVRPQDQIGWQDEGHDDRPTSTAGSVV
ncbi:MAG: hypothetical protein OXB92_12905 [Acidimicrobiaceae bacterium]|nr:hypothetical protein [Acidimicrobiia bacterium]MCY4494748.1 hypothetical protein [Acidimicrobiaceae bacterium]